MENVQPRMREPWKAFEVRQRKPELKREMVLKTAAHLFLERGYRKTSMNDLAERLNITKPAVYHYFQNKEGILVSCYEHGIASIEARLQRADWESGNGLDKTRAYVRAYVDAVVTIEFGQCVATLDDGELSAGARAKVRKLKRRIDGTLRRFIDEGVADGSIRPCSSKLISFAIAGAINWIGTWYNPGGSLCPNEIVESFTDYLIDGLTGAHGGLMQPGARKSKKHPGKRRKKKTTTA